MSWHFAFVAASTAAALAQLDKIAEDNEHAAGGVALVRPIVAAFPTVEGFGLSLTSNGHIAPEGSYSNVVVDVKHVQIIAEPSPG